MIATSHAISFMPPSIHCCITRYNEAYYKAGPILTLPDDIPPNVTVIAKYTVYKNIEEQLHRHWKGKEYDVEEVVFVRHPAATWASISKKGYATYCKSADAVAPHEITQGSPNMNAAIAEKSAEVDRIYAKAVELHRYNAKVVHSERWIKNPALVCAMLGIGGGCSNSSSLVLSEYDWHRHNTIVLGNRVARHLPPFGNGGSSFHGGTVKQQPIPNVPVAVLRAITRLQPNLMAYYAAQAFQHFASTENP